MLGKTLGLASARPNLRFGCGLFSHDTPAFPHAGPFHREEQAKMRAWIAPDRRAAGNDDCRGCAEPDSIPQGHLEGNRKNPAVRNDRVPFRVSEGGRRSRPGGDPYRPGSGWASDLGNDIGRKQRRQGAVCVGGHGGQQDHHRRRHRRLLPHHDLVAGPDGEMLRAECCFVPASDRSVLLCDVAGQSIVAEPELPARWPTPRPAAEPGGGHREKLGLNLVSRFRSSHHCAAHSFCELRNQRDTGARLQW